MARFQSFWLGKSLPPCQKLCMKSFIDYGHEYDLYTYDPVPVPEGVRVLDACEILHRNEVFFYRHGKERGSVAGFADLFRYRLLMLRGGWWVDTDVVCLSSKIPEGEIFMERQCEELICTAVLKFPKGHEFVKTLYEISRDAGKNIIWSQIGPDLLTSLAHQAGLWGQTGLREQAYPIYWKEASLPVTTRDHAAADKRTRSAAFLHLWNEVFRREGSLALHHPPDGSFLADLYKAHGVRRGFGGLWFRYKLRRCRLKVRDFMGKSKRRLIRILRFGFSH